MTTNTRREFLAMLAATLAAGPASAAFARPRLQPSQDSQAALSRGPAQHVLVFGAGLAGLCTAYELQKLGHTVTVLEAQTRPGGRVRTLRDTFAPGVYTEAGAEQIPGVHDLTQHYAREFGLPLVPNSVPATRSFFHVRGRRIVLTDTNPPPEWPFDLTADERALGYGGLSRKYIDEAVQQAQAAGYAQHAAQSLHAWDALTPGAWLRSRGASAGATELLALGFGADFGSAASFLLHRLNSMGSTARYRIEGGNDRLPAEFAKRVQVRYGAPIVSVRQDDRGVEVTIAGGSQTLRADRAVCAIPCPVIGTIFEDARLSAAKARAIREQHYSRTVKVFLQSRTRFWLKDGWSGNVTTDLPIERLTPDPGGDPGARGALAAYPIGLYTQKLEAMSESERVSAAREQAQQIFPELAEQFEGGVAHCWGLDPWQRGAFALHTPGQIDFIDVLAAAEGRIHFAGEHTSVWTGWMQGALESARRVVREITA